MLRPFLLTGGLKGGDSALCVNRVNRANLLRETRGWRTRSAHPAGRSEGDILFLLRVKFIEHPPGGL